MQKLSIFTVPPDAMGALTLDNGTFVEGVREEFQGRSCLSFSIPDDAPQGNGCSLLISRPGYTQSVQRAILWLNRGDVAYPWSEGQQAALATDDFYLQESQTQGSHPIPPLPPVGVVPSRMETLGVNMHFRGGEIVESPTYGKMLWWDGCLSWCDPETRAQAYEVGHAYGDTHKILHIPSGAPLYSSGSNNGNFYGPARFPALDWTNGMTRLDNRFTDLVDEIIGNGFKVIVTMDEVYSYSIQLVRMVMEALKPHQIPWVLTLPGYDGVFYGWEPSNTLIPGWARLARSIQPNALLGIEFNPGHIPLGNGPVDYAPGGVMDGFDAILGEFPTVPPNLANLDECNKVWQVLGRMIRPYNRPAAQLPENDPNPPFYLVDSPRGPRTFIAFETWNPYNWVRIDPNDTDRVMQAQAQIELERSYFRQLGCTFIG